MALSRLQRVTIVLLRTAIGWHFLYGGIYKLMLPRWPRAGDPVATWSAAGYLKAASGPLAGVFHALAQSRALGTIDAALPIALVAIGASLIAGLFTQAGCAGAMALLTAFYLSAIPTTGSPQAGAEGTYLLVSKNLVELIAVAVVFAPHTGQIAGLDLLRPRRSPITRAGPAPTSA